MSKKDSMSGSNAGYIAETNNNQKPAAEDQNKDSLSQAIEQPTLRPLVGMESSAQDTEQRQSSETIRAAGVEKTEREAFDFFGETSSAEVPVNVEATDSSFVGENRAKTSQQQSYAPPPASKEKKYLLLIPVLFILLFTVLPMLYSFFVSMKSYNFAQGLRESPWIGFQNYIREFRAPYMMRASVNSLKLTVFPGIILTIIGFFAAATAPLVSKGVARGLFFFIPTLCTLLPQDFWEAFPLEVRRQLFMGAGLHISSIVHGIGIVVLFSGGVAILVNEGAKAPTRGWLQYLGAIVSGLSFIFHLFTPITSMIYNVSAPALDTSETLDLYAYKILFLTGELSRGAAVWNIKIFLQVFPAMIGLVIFLILPVQQAITGGNRPDKKMSSSFIPFLIGGGAIALVSLLFCIAVGAQTTNGIVRESINTLIVLLSGAIFLFAWLFPVYRVAQGNMGRGIAAVFLLISGTTGNVGSEFVQARVLGLVNNMGGLVASAAYSSKLFLIIAGVAVLSYVGRHRARPFVVALFGIGLVSIVQDTLYPRIFIQNADTFPLPVLLRQIRYSGDITSQYHRLYIPYLLFCLGIGIAFCGLLFSKEKEADTAASSHGVRRDLQ